MKILVKNGRVIDPARNFDEICDVAVAAGRIIGIGSVPEGFAPNRVIDAGGCIVAPGLVDLAVRLREPGADLAVAAALLSSLHNTPTPADALYLGEIGLGGEIRPIGGVERRLTEAGRLGFRRAFGSPRQAVQVPGLHHIPLSHVDELVRALAA